MKERARGAEGVEEATAFPRAGRAKRSGVTKGCLADESTAVKALFVEGSGVGSVDDCVLVCVM